MKRYDDTTRIRAVKYYRSGNTLARTAARFNIHSNTVWRWVGMDMRGGRELLTGDTASHRHWKRLPEDVEEAIIGVKESAPGITVRKAQKVLQNKGMEVSLKGIWSTWQRHGLTGFAREEISHSYQEYLQSAVSPRVLERIRKYIDRNELHRAADIVNALPVFPYNEIILQIPSRLLSLRRQVNRMRAEFGRIPLARYVKKARALRQKMVDRGMCYSSLWVTIAECYALMWSGRPHEVLKAVSMVKRKIRGIRDARLRFLILLLEGQASAGLMRIRKAKACVDQCKIIARTSKDPHFLMGGIGGIYSTMGYYREALLWTGRALQGAAPGYREQLYVNIAQFYGTSGDYRAAFPALRKGNLEAWGFRSRASLIRAYVYLDKGNFQKALTHTVDVLQQVKMEGVRSLLHPATLILASCHKAAGESRKASTLLREIVPLLKKYNLNQEYWQRKIILGKTDAPEETMRVPALRLAHLLRRAQVSMRAQDYHAAVTYAHTKKIFGIFMRLIPFFPEPVVHRLNIGQNTRLPRTFLDMPVFRIDAPVFTVNFLGRVLVQRQGKPARRMTLSPKDTAFLVHMSLNKNRQVALKDLYENFWAKSGQPARNLSHLLTRLRRSLAIPSHLMRIQGETLWWDVFFSTDYENFKEHVAKGRFFEQAGEKNYAAREYERAFRLYRGEPFQGMYDNWSERLRRVIMNTVESVRDSGL